MRLHPPNYSHSLFNIHTSYNYTKLIQMMLFYLMLRLAPHGLDLGFLGLRLWAWTSSFAKNNKKNFKWFGPCPFLLLIASFWFSSLCLEAVLITLFGLLLIRLDGIFLILVTLSWGCSRSTFWPPSDQTWWWSPFPQGKATSSSYTS